jgi:glyoxalase-like protein
MTSRLPSVDHLVYATPDLDRGMREIEQLTGVTPTLGGQHPGRGTRNALIALGGDAYLEIVAPDPGQPPPTTARWLGVDEVTSSRLTTWAAKSHDPSALRTHAVERGVTIGDVRSGERQRADGLRLSWQLTNPDPLVADGLIPFFIDWGESPHPSRSAAHGATLVALHLEHPDVAYIERLLRALYLDISVVAAEKPAIVAVIDGRSGRVQLR